MAAGVLRPSACQPEAGFLDPQSLVSLILGLSLKFWSGSISGLKSNSSSLSGGVGASAPVRA